MQAARLHAVAPVARVLARQGRAGCCAGCRRRPCPARRRRGRRAARRRAASSVSWSLRKSSSQPPCASRVSRRQMPVNPVSTSHSSRSRRLRKRAPPTPSGVASAKATRRDQRPSPTAIWGPSDAGRVPGAQPLDAARQVGLGVVGVGVHARDELAARAAQPDVERVRRPARRVSQHAHAPVALPPGLEDVRAAVGRAAVDEQELDVPVEALGEHVGDHPVEVALLVEHGRQHAHVDGAHRPAPRRRPKRVPARLRYSRNSSRPGIRSRAVAPESWRK